MYFGPIRHKKKSRSLVASQVLEFILLTIHGECHFRLPTARSVGRWEGHGSQVILLAAWKGSRAIKTTSERWWHHPVPQLEASAIYCISAIFSNHKVFENYHSARFPRFLLQTAMLLLLPGIGLDLWDWQSGMCWISLHKFWEASRPPKNAT